MVDPVFIPVIAYVGVSALLIIAAVFFNRPFQ